MTTITVTFDPPSPSDSPAVFNNKAFATLGDLNAWSVQANTVAGEVNTNASNAATSAGTADTAAATATTKAGEALSSANSASTSAGTATTQAGIATTQAGIATTKAAEAASSAADAAATVASKVTGPASVTDNALVRFDGTTGKLVQSSGVTVDDSGNATFSGAVAFTAGSLNATNNIFATWKNAAGLLSAGTSGAFVGKASDNNFYIQNFEGDFVVQRAGYGVSFKIGPAGNSTFGGNLVVEGGTIGYGAGSGGTVTQATSKSTAVTLNKPSGLITMHNAALAAGDSVAFLVSNTTVSALDIVVMTVYNNGNYTVQATTSLAGQFSVRLTNITAGSLPEAVSINFSVIKGSAS